MSTRLPCARLVVPTCVVAVALAVAPLPLRGVVADAVQDALHASGFAGFTFLLIRCATADVPADRRRRRFALAVALVLGLAVVTEGAQFFTPRDSNPGDFARDLLGIVLGVVTIGFGATTSRVRRAGAVAVVVAGIVAVTVPVVSSVRASVQRSRSLPVLHDFVHAWERRFVHTRGVEVSFVGGDTAHPGLLRARYHQGDWPAVIFRELPPDWSAYEALVVEVENPSDAAVALGVRVDDDFAGDPAYEDRFQRSFDLEPGWNTLRIPIREIVTEVTGHDFDPARVTSVAVFTGGRQALLFTVRFDTIRLEES